MCLYEKSSLRSKQVLKDVIGTELAVRGTSKIVLFSCLARILSRSVL